MDTKNLLVIEKYLKHIVKKYDVYSYVNILSGNICVYVTKKSKAKYKKPEYGGVFTFYGTAEKCIQTLMETLS